MPHLPVDPIHLGPGATASVQPEMTDESWYEAYTTRHAADGIDGRLVSQFSFDESWQRWEMHPHGAEVVICTQGSFTLHQERADGGSDTVTLTPGDYAINPPGCWHTADIPAGTAATAIFITPGLGTTHRAR